ncbi:hypothetical protein TWF788_000265 [Orbilia oligospora]|uniref:DUF6594 domain-containing protein n=1 Tax=Orbilia oligospora TaxID=2813651 RepID=A0A7C8Q517_ORBOL|nr:hypothetical protein TWF788_000265 [Orbilia oligospora]KAF3208462.1 hypothetical protein TWF191_000653 [Orbilia oligospora]
MGTFTVSPRSSISSRSGRLSRRRSRDLEAARGSDSGNNGGPEKGDIVRRPTRRLTTRHSLTVTQKRRPIPVHDVPLGYSKLAAFIDLEDDLAIFRRFSRLHARLLLYRQADIEEIEEDLAELDMIEEEEARNAGTPDNALNRSWRREKDLDEYRVELVKKLRKSMKEYDDELFRYKQKLALKGATDWQIENVKTWMDNHHPHPLVPREKRFLEDKGDICALQASSEDSAVLTNALRGWARDAFGCMWLFKKKGNPASYGDPSITYYSTDWKDALMRVAYAALVSALLIAGVIALFYVQSDEGRLAVLCVSTLVCGVVMALFTTARKGEIMGGTAAYCAVMVVFVGSTLNGDGASGGSSGSMAKAT